MPLVCSIAAANRNIDTGLGLERMAQICKSAEQLRNRSVYPLIETAAGLAASPIRSNNQAQTSLR